MTDSNLGLGDDELDAILKDERDAGADVSKDGSAESSGATPLFAVWADEFGAASGASSGRNAASAVTQFSEGDSSGLQDILAVAAALDAPASQGDEEDDAESLVAAASSSQMGIVVVASDEEIFGEGFGGASAVPLVAFDEDDTSTGGSSSASTSGKDLIGEVQAAASRSRAAMRPTDLGRRTRTGRRPWLAVAVVLLALSGGVAMVLIGDERGADRGPENSAGAGVATLSAGERVGVRKSLASDHGAEVSRHSEEAPRAEELAYAQVDEPTLKDGPAQDPSTFGAKVPNKDSSIEGSNALVPQVDPKTQGKGRRRGDPEADPEAEPGAEPEPAPGADVEGGETGSGVPSGGTEEQDRIDCLLNSSLPKCKQKAAPKPEHTEKDAGTPALPDKLKLADLRGGFGKVKPAARACGATHGAEPGVKVKVHVSIMGATGKVKKARALGPHADSALGRCVADVAKAAVFTSFAREVMGTEFSFRM